MRYRVSNWREYNQSLIQRGDVELWFNESVLSQWTLPAATGRRGRPRIYSDLAMQCLFALRLLYNLPLRATQGLFISLLRLLGCPLTVPNYSTLCRRQARLNPGLALTVAKSYFRFGLPVTEAPTAARNHAPTMVAAQAICIMIRYLLAACMFAGFLCSYRINA